MIPKLAFLFLTIANVYHEQTWINFFADHQLEYSLYVHSKQRLSKNSFFKPHEIPVKVDTSWENTMNAQRELLKEALKDPANEKFIFLSESTIPLQSFDAVYTKLMAHASSQFNFYRNPHAYRSFGHLKAHDLYKNSQWVVLNRKHAELMVHDDSLITIMTAEPHDQEHYPSTFLAQHGLLHEVVKKDITLCIWNGVDAHPHSFTDLATDMHLSKLIKIIENQRFLFARKFDKTCDLSALKGYLPWIEDKAA